MMVDPIMVRASSLSDWTDCPRRAATRTFGKLIVTLGYELRTILGHPGAAIGVGVHAAAATMLRAKAETGELPPVSVTDDAGIEALRERIADGVVFDRQIANLNDAEKQVRRMSNTYRYDIAPQVNPIHVEERFEAPVPYTRYPLILSGQADTVAREPELVRDLKTGRRSAHRPQLGAYGLLSRTMGLDIKGVAEDFIPRVSLKQPQPDAETYHHDLAGCEQAAVAVLKHMDATLDTFLNGDDERHIQVGEPWAFPANPKSMLCSEKFCSAWGTEFCHEHQKGELAS